MPAFIIVHSLTAIRLTPHIPVFKGPNLLDFLGDLRRTHMCGALRPNDSGKKAVLMGWVNRRRDLGNLIFIDIRDRSGVTQVVFNKERDPAVHQKGGGSAQ